MMKTRLLSGALAVAALVGLAVGPVSAAGATTAHPNNTLNFSGKITCASCSAVTKPIHFNGSGNITIQIKDQAVPGDHFRATYVDPTNTIRGACAASSTSSYQTSLRVHIPSTRNYKIRVTWCGTSASKARFPAGFFMRSVA